MPSVRKDMTLLVVVIITQIILETCGHGTKRGHCCKSIFSYKINLNRWFWHSASRLILLLDALNSRNSRQYNKLGITMSVIWFSWAIALDFQEKLKTSTNWRDYSPSYHLLHLLLSKYELWFYSSSLVSSFDRHDTLSHYVLILSPCSYWLSMFESSGFLTEYVVS